MRDGVNKDRLLCGFCAVAVNWCVRLADWTLSGGLQTDFAGTWLGVYLTLSGVRLQSNCQLEWDVCRSWPVGHQLASSFFCISLGLKQVEPIISVLSCLPGVCSK